MISKIYIPLLLKGKTMTTALKKDIMEEAYEDTKNLICSSVWGFIRTWGCPYECDFEELLSIGNLSFTEAVLSYNPEYGSSFSSWLYENIQQKLKNNSRAVTIRRKHMKYVSTIGTEREPYNPIAPAPRIDWFSVLDSLNQDAQTVLQLLFDPPDAVLELRKPSRLSYEKSLARPIKTYLKTCGWTARRIKEAIEDLKNAVEN